MIYSAIYVNVKLTVNLILSIDLHRFSYLYWAMMLNK